MSTLRRWLPTVALALLLAAGCAAAGAWQWHRHAARSAAVAVVEANYGADPAPIETVLEQGDLNHDDVWRPVTATGRYLPATVLLRNRPVDGQAGFHVLVPFVVEEGPLRGGVLVVDRGWVPTGKDAAGPAGVPATPRGSVDVVVRLRADEPASPRDAPPGQVQAISVGQVRAAADLPQWTAENSVSAYGALVSEDGAGAQGLGRLPRPSTSLGSHLSYAFQWWVFGAGTLVGCAVLIRRDVRDGRLDAAGGLGSAAEGGPAEGAAVEGRERRARRRATAEEEEDAVLDAQDARARRLGAPH